MAKALIYSEKRAKKVQLKRLTGFERKLLDIIKNAEDVQIAYCKRKNIPRRLLQLTGKLGLNEDEGVGAIRRKILVSPEYSRELLHTLHNENLLSKTKLDKYTLSREALERIAYELRKIGYVRTAVNRILRGDLAKRGYIEALREHKTPRKTTIIPPIVGYFK